MKNFRILMVMMSFFCVQVIWAQLPSMEVTLKVYNSSGGVLKNTQVDFVEINTRDRVSATTNEAGIAKALVTGGTYWQIQVLEIKDYYPWQFKMHKRAVKGEMTLSVSYNYKHYLRETMPTVDRSKLKIEEVKQKHKSNVKPTPTLALAKVTILKKNRAPLSGVRVALTNYKQNKSYVAYTDARGLAVFMVPYASLYQLDVDEINDFSYLDTPKKKGMVSNKRLTYEPTYVEESIKNDTVIQDLEINPKGTSSRDLVSLTVKGGIDGIYKNEAVYLSEIRGNLTYKGFTNEKGKAVFLLPKGKKYMIHFDYQRDLDVFDLTRSHGIGHSNKTLTYRPNPRLQFPETFIPKPEELYISNFKNFITKQLEHKDESKGLDFKAYFGNKINAYSREAVLNLEFTTNPSQDYVKTPAINLGIVIDKSGSMAGYERIENLKSAMVQMVEKLRPIDRVSITVFDGGNTVIVPSKLIGEDKNTIIDNILRIDADGGTNIYTGLQEGYYQVAKHYKKGLTNRVVLLTDGYGTTPIDTILEFVKLQHDQGIECSVVGVGQGYNVSLLEQIGALGGGLISLVENSNAIHQVFVKEISSLVTPIAKNVKLEVEYNKKIVFSQLYGMELEQNKDGKATLKRKNMYAGLSDIALIRFNLDNPDKSIEETPVIVRIKYFDYKTQTRVIEEKKVFLEWSDFTGELEVQLDKHQKKLYAIAVMNQSLKVMAESSVTGNYKLAVETIEQTIKSVEKTFPNAHDNEVETLRKSLEEYLVILKRI